MSRICETGYFSFGECKISIIVYVPCVCWVDLCCCCCCCCSWSSLLANFMCSRNDALQSISPITTSFSLLFLALLFLFCSLCGRLHANTHPQRQAAVYRTVRQALTEFHDFYTFPFFRLNFFLCVCYVSLWYIYYIYSKYTMNEKKNQSHSVGQCRKSVYCPHRRHFYIKKKSTFISLLSIILSDFFLSALFFSFSFFVPLVVLCVLVCVYTAAGSLSIFTY